MSYITYQMFDHDMWAVTLSAPCYHPEAASMELVAGLHRFPSTKRRIQFEMMRTYDNMGRQHIPGMHTSTDDVPTIILYDCCVSHYNELRTQLLASPKGPDWLLESISDDHCQKQAMLVAKTLFLLPPAGIRAWNIARAIYYIRCCLLLDREAPQTAMAKILGIAKNAQQLYNSWEEYITAFAVGEQFTSKNPDVRMSESRIDELSQLMISNKSAARFLPWNLQL